MRKDIIMVFGLLVSLGCGWSFVLLWQKQQMDLADRFATTKAVTDSCRLLEFENQELKQMEPRAKPAREASVRVAMLDEDLISVRSKNPPDPRSIPLADYYQIIIPQARVDYILVVISGQVLYAYSQGKPALSERISTASTGINLPPETNLEVPHNHVGLFKVESKNADAYSNVYDCPMPYALFYFHGHAIHQTERKYYSLLGQPASHGCVREGPVAARWLFEHTPVGTIVDIRESLQLTEPPSLRGAG